MGYVSRILLIRQPIAVSDISVYICLIDIRSKSKEQLNERRAGLSNHSSLDDLACTNMCLIGPIFTCTFFLLCFFHVSYLSVHSNQSTMKLTRASSKFSTGSNLV